ncbi:hypothetical protein GOP47_0008275 [Adiantum capillus-veneris]|uniref:Secreted protein n=1 Tax=Adiantum capillus-veneris TaxID=13818 RepID=A0A9D4ZKI4_ADICA|nr:hypothetical protein GOP47_0008275 [Adiantum capillus-veneris]
MRIYGKRAQALPLLVILMLHTQLPTFSHAFRLLQEIAPTPDDATRQPPQSGGVSPNDATSPLPPPPQSDGVASPTSSMITITPRNRARNQGPPQNCC